MAIEDPQYNTANDVMGDMVIDDYAQPAGNGRSPSGRDTVYEAPRGRRPRDTFQSIEPFSTPYKSVFTANLAKSPVATGVLECLEHVNCSYFSSGVPPNLLQLKQHAQSLTVLIKELTVSTLPALIDNGSGGTRSFCQNESFDWLNNLSEPYSTDDAHHRQPLTSILNTVETSPTTGETRNICPLREIRKEDLLVQKHPYATHSSLIQHANEVLERLDHEYSATGGLLSIFPTEMKKEDREKAEKTVLGQMIFWVQNLVQRIHHLERLYANSMDILANEAVVPTETLSALGTSGRMGREVVYPQDRFVLANAGDDLWDFLNAEFERKEVIDTQVDKRYRDLGATGEAIWAQRGGKEFAQGITFIDVYTRYYRLRDNPLKTIFVIPAYEIHPGTKVTREIEKQPTVVTVVKPVWPERTSVLEAKHKSDMAELKRLRQESIQHKQDMAMKEMTEQVLNRERETLKQANQELKRAADDSKAYLKLPANSSKAKNFEQLGKINEIRMEAAKVQAHYERQIAETKAALEKAKVTADEIKKARDEQVALLKAHEQEAQRDLARKRKEIEDFDAAVGRACVQNAKLLKEQWLKQMTESQILIEFLNDENAESELADREIPEHVRQRGEKIAKRRFNAVAATIPDVVPRQSQPSPSASSSSEEEGSESRVSRLSKAPQKPSWRQESRTLSPSPEKTAAAAWRASSGPASSYEPFGSGRLRRSSAPVTPHETDDSKKMFAASSPGSKKVRISPTEIMGPTGSGLRADVEPPSKRMKTDLLSPRNIMTGRQSGYVPMMSGGLRIEAEDKDEEEKVVYEISDDDEDEDEDEEEE